MTVQYRSERFDPGRIQAVFFDIDGTLADTDDVLVEQIARYLGPLRTFFPGHAPQRMARRLVMAFESPTNWILHALDRSGLDQGFGWLLNEIHRLRGDRSRGDARLIPSTQIALERLAPQYALAVVTARERRSAEAILKELAISRYFECVVTARTCRYSKPHPAPVLWAAKQLNHDPASCLMVGDTTVDILSGQRAGAQTAAVLSGFGEEGELVAAGADLVLDSVGGLPKSLSGEHP